MSAEAWFYKNGVHVFSYDSFATIPNNTLSDIGFVPDNAIGNGEIWNCQIRLADGINTTAFSTSNKYSTLSDVEAKNANTTGGLVTLAVIGLIVAIFVFIMVGIKK
jgi:hypothetical protein